MKKFLHDKLGWGYPTILKQKDSFQPLYKCKYCDEPLAQDSTKSWFHLQSFYFPPKKRRKREELVIQAESYIKTLSNAYGNGFWSLIENKKVLDFGCGCGRVLTGRSFRGAPVARSSRIGSAGSIREPRRRTFTCRLPSGSFISSEIKSV